MYDWVTDTWTPLAGECPHRCSYCYVREMAKRFPSVRQKYSGALRLEPEEKWPKLGKGKRWFVGHMNDLWADAVDPDDRRKVLRYCCQWKQNEYVFQTKNPEGLRQHLQDMPAGTVLGVTIESNLWNENMGFADRGGPPSPITRLVETLILRDKWVGRLLFVTVEPIMEFGQRGVYDFVGWLEDCRPDWVNIGADSKGNRLPEPAPEEVVSLVQRLRALGIDVRLKPNLVRLLGRELYGKIGGGGLPVAQGDGV